jgi:hypothetical protein
VGGFSSLRRGGENKKKVKKFEQIEYKNHKSPK